jgi:hypothetical protein
VAVIDRLQETPWCYAQAATASVPTASAVTACNGWPAIPIPAGQFTKLGTQTSKLRLVIQAQLTATATVPTFSFGLAISQVQPAAFSAGTLLHAISAAVTPTAGTAYQTWMEWDILLRAKGAPGANSTLLTTGRVRCLNGFPSPFEVTMPQSYGVNTLATYDPEQVAFLWPYITLSAATAGNTITPQSGMLYAEC